MISDWTLCGQITVDAGCVILVDPCYVLPNRDRPGLAYERAARLDEPGEPPLIYDLPDVTSGILVSTGYGDGVYDVFARYTEEGRVAELRVVFIEDAAGARS
jgi:hypothetical protein